MANLPFEIPPSKPEATEDAAMPFDLRTSHSQALSILQKHEATLMAIDGVEGVGVGQNAIGDETIVVYVRDNGVNSRVPRDIDGLKIEVKVTGSIDAL